MTLSSHTFFFNTSEDAFFGTGNPRLELTMFFLGGGYKFNDRITVTAGNMNNIDFRKTKDQCRNFLYFTFLFDLTPGKQHPLKEPVNDVISRK